MALGLTQADLASLAEVHLNHLGNMERRSDYSPSLLVLLRLAGALETDAGSLVAGLSIPPPPHAVRAVDARRKAVKGRPAKGPRARRAR
ncbi:MAG: helix-turn-helix transcriptional regulator [Planctomycetes bacterium]|nr:helix-turn-helix transcriptional regulator [Planctomycetota bacterium]